jgi:hypothetical protein
VTVQVQTTGNTVDVNAYGGSTLLVEDVGPNGAYVPSTAPFPAWLPLPLNAGWAVLSADWSLPGYRKVGDMVQLRGVMGSPNINAPATLPVGYRPPRHMMFIAWAATQPNGGRMPLRLDIGSNGTIGIAGGTAFNVFNTPSGTTNTTATAFDHLSLDGIQFSVTP